MIERKFTNARYGNIISDKPVFHIVITGYDEKTGNIYFSEHKAYPGSWLIGKPFKPALIRHLGAIEFKFYDYEVSRNDWLYFFIAQQVMRDEGLNKS